MKNFKLHFALSLSALALVSCGPQPPEDKNVYQSTRICRDEKGVRVEDYKCETALSTNNSGGGASNALMWFFIGQAMANNTPRIGSYVDPSYGSYRPRDRVVYYPSSPNGGHQKRPQASPYVAPSGGGYVSTPQTAAGIRAAAGGPVSVQSSGISRGGFGSSASSSSYSAAS